MKSEFLIAEQVQTLLKPLSSDRRERVIKWVQESLTSAPEKEDQVPNVRERRVRTVKKQITLKDKSITETCWAILRSLVTGDGVLLERTASETVQALRDTPGLPKWIRGEFAQTRLGRDLNKLQVLGLLRKDRTKWALTDKGLSVMKGGK